MYRILLVEDDDVIANVIRKYLSRWGYDVHCVDDFNDVLGCFTRISPHLVLMDISLPFYNGYHWQGDTQAVRTRSCSFPRPRQHEHHNGGEHGRRRLHRQTVRPGSPAGKIEALLRRTYAYNEQSEWLEHRGVMFNTLDGTIMYQEENRAYEE